MTVQRLLNANGSSMTPPFPWKKSTGGKRIFPSLLRFSVKAGRGYPPEGQDRTLVQTHFSFAADSVRVWLFPVLMLSSGRETLPEEVL